MKNLNIAMIVQGTYPDDPRVRRQAEALARSGYNIDIISLRKSHENRTDSYGTINVHRILFKSSKETLFRYLQLSFLFFVLSSFKLLVLSLKKKYAVIHINNLPDFLVFAALPQKLRKIPVILDIHDVSVELFKSKWPDKKLVFTFISFIEKYSCKFASQIITTSQEFKDKLISRNVPAKKIQLILNTPNKIFKLDNTRIYGKIDRDLSIIYHGTVAYRFGIHNIIEALNIVKSTVPDSKLLVFGSVDDSYRIVLNDLINKYNLENFVSLNKPIPWEEIYKIICKSDVGVVPYLDQDFMHLALSTKTFEYIASGLPVVASRMQSLNHIFDDTCLTFCEAGNADDLAQKIIWLCNNPIERKEKAQKAVEVMKPISGKVMEDRYINLIMSLIR